jgi:hypothetical protein
VGRGGPRCVAAGDCAPSVLILSFQLAATYHRAGIGVAINRRALKHRVLLPPLGWADRRHAGAMEQDQQDGGQDHDRCHREDQHDQDVGGEPKSAAVVPGFFIRSG